MAALGHSLLKKCFYLYDGLVNLNHGSFGTVPREVMAAQRALHDRQESCPELWFREWYKVDLDNARKDIATLVNAEVEDVVFVENASYAINSIVASFPFEDNDVVICFDCAYRMVKEALRVAQIRKKLQLVYIPVQYPIASSQELIASLKEELDKHAAVKLCIFDHVSSMPSILFPVVELTTLAKAKSATVLIDGAHAPGMVEIDVRAIGADLYTGNCHKWLFAPKGTAFLWTKREVQTDDFPLPCVVSSTGRRDYIGRFEYTGTRDYTPFLSFPAALQFIDSRLGGIQAMRTYNRDLLHKASELVRARWGTDFVVPEEMNGYMSDVGLPAAIVNMEQVVKLEQLLLKRHISMKCEAVRRRSDSATASGGKGEGEGEMIHFVRLSAQVYLELSDYEVMADAVLELLPQVVS